MDRLGGMAFYSGVPIEVDGQIVAGTIQTQRMRAGTVQHGLEGWVRPDVRRRGLGRALLHWIERRARETAAD